MMKQGIPSRQKGAVLLIALVFLALIALISATSMDSSKLEVFMAGNQQVKLDAGQRAQAIVDYLASEDDSFRVTTVGYIRCSSGHANTDCDTSDNLAITDSDVNALVSGADEITFSNEFYYENPKVPRTSLGNASGQSYEAAYFDIRVLYDNSDNRGGRAEVSQGIGVRVPSGEQGGRPPAGTDSDTQMQVPLN